MPSSKASVNQALIDLKAASPTSASQLSVLSKANQFYIYINQQLIPWDIYEPNSENRGFVRYFSQALQIVDQQVQGLTFYVTMTEMHSLPSYGDHVVVLILGDEFYRVPKYCHKVGAVFKCYGTHQIRQQLLNCLSSQPFYLKFALISQSLKNLTYRLPLLLNYQFQKLVTILSGKGNVTLIHDIPPGYFNSEDLPVEPIASRRHDVFFDGSISHDQYSTWSLKYWMRTPKSFARGEMIKNLKKTQAHHPQLKIELATNFKFAAPDQTTEQSIYSQNMMQTKICCVPRGTTVETYRFFEAMRYGCIIITESLPSCWFYQGAPVVQLKNWDELEEVIQNLLQDPALVQELHQQTLDWWAKKCSEISCGQYIAENVKSMVV